MYGNVLDQLYPDKERKKAMHKDARALLNEPMPFLTHIVNLYF